MTEDENDVFMRFSHVAKLPEKHSNGPCRKCGERSHKARKCESVKVKSGAAKVKNNPPEGLPSTSLEGGSRTGVSDKLGKVPNNEMTILQSTWML